MVEIYCYMFEIYCYMFEVCSRNRYVPKQIKIAMPDDTGRLYALLFVMFICYLCCSLSICKLQDLLFVQKGYPLCFVFCAELRVIVLMCVVLTFFVVFSHLFRARLSQCCSCPLKEANPCSPSNPAQDSLCDFQLSYALVPSAMPDSVINLVIMCSQRKSRECKQNDSLNAIRQQDFHQSTRLLSDN